MYYLTWPGLNVYFVSPHVTFRVSIKKYDLFCNRDILYPRWMITNKFNVGTSIKLQKKCRFMGTLASEEMAWHIAFKELVKGF